MLDFAEAEVDIGDAGLARVLPRLLDHLRGHVDADGLARAHGAHGDEAVDARAAAEVEHDLAGLNLRRVERIAAAEAEVGAGGNIFQIFEIVADLLGDRSRRRPRRRSTFLRRSNCCAVSAVLP